MKVFITGGAGFVGWHLSRQLLSAGHSVTVFDLLDPVSVNPDLGVLQNTQGFRLVFGNILDLDLLAHTLKGHDVIIHAAAQSSVDRSIRDPHVTFIANAVGTVSVLEAARSVGVNRVHYVSTDEVFGPAQLTSRVQRPTNPYSAGKAAGEAAVSAWTNTYGLHVTTTNSANTYGPRQAPEKLIPRLIVRAIHGNTLPIYGDGRQSREWLFVTDHCSAIICATFKGSPGESYGIGTGELVENVHVARLIVDSLGLSRRLLVHVKDRPGHDKSYSVNAERLRELGWSPRISFSQGLRTTIDWYKQNQSWWTWFGEHV